MLYLAEVQKTKAGFSEKTELKLLACQRGEQNWSAVGEEVIASEEASKLNKGTLVLVELSANKQVQRPPQEAARQLVSILQNFSRQQEKSKTQEEEIEQWKQSLTFQSQELNRREMELQAREEQLQEMEGEFERLEAMRQEIDSSRDEANRLQEELTRNRQELEGAWEHLRGEMRQIEEQQGQLSAAAGKTLDDEQARYIQDVLDRLSEAIAPTESVREQLNLAFERVDSQQSILSERWQQLEVQRTSAQQLGSEVDRMAQDIYNRDRDWQQAHASLDRARSELLVLQNTLKLKQEYAQTWTLRLQSQEELYQQLYRLADTVDNVSISEKVNVEPLEKMPVDELQGLVQQLKQDLEKVSRFVNDQQEELEMQSQSIEEVQGKLNLASDYDRRKLEEELAEEQDRYQMLNETLKGQLHNLRKREEILSQHQAVLWRRMGNPVGQGQDGKLDMGSILSQIEGHRQQQTEELQKLEREIHQMRQSIQQAEGTIASQGSQQDAKHNEIKQLEVSLQQKRVMVAELSGKVNVYQEMLQPIQEGLNELRQKLEAAAGMLNQVQETGDYQLSAIANMRQVFGSLTNQHSQQSAAS